MRQPKLSLLTGWQLAAASLLSRLHSWVGFTPEVSPDNGQITFLRVYILPGALVFPKPGYWAPIDSRCLNFTLQIKQITKKQ